MAVISTAFRAVSPLALVHAIPNCSTLIDDPLLPSPLVGPMSTCTHTNTSTIHVSSASSGLATKTAVPIICAFLILLFVVCFTYRDSIRQLVGSLCIGFDHIAEESKYTILGLGAIR